MIVATITPRAISETEVVFHCTVVGPVVAMITGTIRIEGEL